MLERLRPLGHTGGTTVLRERLVRLRPRRDPKVFLNLDFAPASTIQVDWAGFGLLVAGLSATRERVRRGTRVLPLPLKPRLHLHHRPEAMPRRSWSRVVPAQPERDSLLAESVVKLAR
jgi:hypothetical protein